MKFDTITEKEFKNFSKNCPLDTFIQTPEMAHIREHYGNKPYYVGVKDNKNKIIAASIISSRKAPFGLQFYAPRGLLVDYNDLETLSFFTEHLKIFIKDKKGYVLRIDPYYINHQKDIDGKNVENGIDHSNGIKNLEKVGFQKSAYIYQKYKYMFCLDLDKDKDTIYSKFHSLPKRMIKKTNDYDITIREINQKELSLVTELLSETGSRKNFSIKDEEYFELLYKYFKPINEVKFMIAEINLKNSIKKVNDKIKNIQKDISSCKDDSKKTTLEEKINQEQKNLEDLKEKLSIYGEKVVASAGVFILHNKEYTYLFGGNKKELLPYGSSYLLQWTMIQEAINLGFSRYNF